MENSNARPQPQPFSQESAEHQQPRITLRAVVTICLGATVALAVDVMPLVEWVRTLV